MSARLVAEEGNLKGLVLPFEGGDQWVIGRDPDACQLLLEDPAASRKHLLCKATPEGILLENLSSTNPVQINDEELKEPRLLKEGDTVRIGSGMFRYFVDLSQKTPEIPAAAPPPDLKPEEVPPAQPEKHDSILEEDPENVEKHKLAEINFDMEETGRWLLKVIGGPNNGAEFSMQTGSTYLIGTDPNTCDIVFHDTSVSRQHARITIDENNNMFVEDLKSRNGTLVDGEAVKDKTTINPNTIVTLGTSSFVIYDREGSMQTIISPLMPSLVKVLQKDDKPAEGEIKALEPAISTAAPLAEHAHPKEKSMGTLILISIITGLCVIAAIGTTALFKSEPIVVKEVTNADQQLADVFKDYPSLKYAFNKTGGNLVLFGHLLAPQDKIQLLNALHGLPFVKAIDDSGIVIDEYVWQEMNQVLTKNPNWRSINLQSPEAGHFILTGTLQTEKQAQQLYDYITLNFPYLDRLEKHVVVEEEIVSSVKNNLEKVGILNTQVAFRNGEVIITGGVPSTKQAEFNQIVAEIKSIPGVKDVRASVNPLTANQSMLNISDRYEVSGFSRIGNNISVVVNGRIVTKGDVLDGMLIKDITPGSVFLEKDSVNYRIDFSK